MGSRALFLEHGREINGTSAIQLVVLNGFEMLKLRVIIITWRNVFNVIFHHSIRWGHCWGPWVIVHHDRAGTTTNNFNHIRILACFARHVANVIHGATAGTFPIILDVREIVVKL